MRCGTRPVNSPRMPLFLSGAPPAYQSSRASAHATIASNSSCGSSGTSSGVTAEVLGDQGPQQHAREGVLGRGLVQVATVVDHGAGDLAVAGPRAPVEVVRAHAGPAVVDDAGLGVHVDRQPGLVAQAEHRDPVAARLDDRAHRQGPPVELRHLGQGAFAVGHHREDHDQPEVGILPQRSGEVLAHVARTTGTGPRRRPAGRPGRSPWCCPASPSARPRVRSRTPWGRSPGRSGRSARCRARRAADGRRR